MRLVVGLIRLILLVIGLSVLAIVAAFVMITGALFMLISGKRPQVRVFRPQDFMAQGGPFARPYERPPMKDVTPQPVAHLDSQS